MPFNVGDSVRLVFPFGPNDNAPVPLGGKAGQKSAIASSCIHLADGGDGIYTIAEVVDLSVGFPAGKGPVQSHMPPTGFTYILNEKPGYFSEKFLRPA